MCMSFHSKVDNNEEIYWGQVHYLIVIRKYIVYRSPMSWWISPPDVVLISAYRVRSTLVARRLRVVTYGLWRYFDQEYYHSQVISFLILYKANSVKCVNKSGIMISLRYFFNSSSSNQRSPVTAVVLVLRYLQRNLIPMTMTGYNKFHYN